MPVKKKKSKKKSHVVDPNQDPDTMMADAAPTSAGGKKKKVKKKKLTAAEKLRAKLDKGADTLLRSGAPFDEYMGRVERWLEKHSDRCIQKFKHFDVNKEGIVSFGEFKSGLVDLDAPFHSVELHLMCLLLDKDETEEIEYEDLKNGFKIFRERESSYTCADVRPVLTLTKRNLEKCTCCKMVKWDGECYKDEHPRFVSIHFKLMTFDNYKQHPAHFHKVVTDSITILGLLEVIRNETYLLTPPSRNHLVIFREKSYEPAAQLPQHLSLEECGFMGGPKNDPKEIKLYYDYKVEFKDCPLLMCDHYFGQKTVVL